MSLHDDIQSALAEEKEAHRIGEKAMLPKFQEQINKLKAAFKLYLKDRGLSLTPDGLWDMTYDLVFLDDQFCPVKERYLPNKDLKDSDTGKTGKKRRILNELERLQKSLVLHPVTELELSISILELHEKECAALKKAISTNDLPDPDKLYLEFEPHKGDPLANVRQAVDDAIQRVENQGIYNLTKKMTFQSFVIIKSFVSLYKKYILPENPEATCSATPSSDLFDFCVCTLTSLAPEIENPEKGLRGVLEKILKK